MKKLTFLLVCIIICGQALSQDRQRFVILTVVNEEIPVYRNPIGNEISYRIMQDRIHELFFFVEILEKSPLRYKVNITSTEDHDNVFPGIVGWIDKSICCVFSRHYYDENNKSYIKLFSYPDSKSSFVKIYASPHNESGEWIVIDYADDNWLKVMFYHDGKLYEGWVDRYCDSIYDSCN